jgi:hypothetical protein
LLSEQKTTSEIQLLPFFGRISLFFGKILHASSREKNVEEFPKRAGGKNQARYDESLQLPKPTH